MSKIKICLKCGDKLLEKAEFCPTCGNSSDVYVGALAKLFNVQTNDPELILVDKDDTKKIQEVINNVKHPNRKNMKPNWQTNSNNKSQELKTSKKINTRTTKRGRKKAAKRSRQAYCPKCGSTSLSSNKKGFGIGKAIIGASLTNSPIGLIGGNINAKKVIVTCLNCGKQWKI